jgi:hypothetical protein
LKEFNTNIKFKIFILKSPPTVLPFVGDEEITSHIFEMKTSFDDVKNPDFKDA